MDHKVFLSLSDPPARAFTIGIRTAFRDPERRTSMKTKTNVKAGERLIIVVC
jgi:hypothetical protein